MEEKDEQMQSTLTEISNQLGQSDAIQSDMAESMSSIKDSMDLMVTTMRESLALEERQNLENRRDEAGDISGASLDDSATPEQGLFGKAKMKIFDMGKVIKEFLMSVAAKLLIGAAALLVYVGLKFWEPIKEFFVDLKNAVMYAFDNVVQWFKDIFAWGKETGTDENGNWTLSTFIWGVIDQVIASISKMWDWVGEQAEKWTLTKMVYDAVDTVIGWVKGLFSWVKTTGTDENGDFSLKTFIFGAIDQVIDWVKGLFSWAKASGTDENGEFSLTTLVFNAISGIGKWFNEKLSFLGDLVPDWGWDFIGIVSDMLTGAGKWLGEKFGFSLEDFGPKLSEEWKAIKDVFFGLFSNIGDMIDDVVDKMTGWVGDIASWFYDSENGTILGGIELPELEWPAFDFEEVKKSFKKLLGGLLPDPDSWLAKVIPDAVYEWVGINPSTGEQVESSGETDLMGGQGSIVEEKIEENIQKEVDMGMELEKAKESGLYEKKGAFRDSKLNKELINSASTSQLQAILADEDLSDEDTEYLKALVDGRLSPDTTASITNPASVNSTFREDRRTAKDETWEETQARLSASMTPQDSLISKQKQDLGVVVAVPAQSVANVSGGNGNEVITGELNKNTPPSAGFNPRGQSTAIVNAPSSSNVTNSTTNTTVQSGPPASSSNNSNKKSAGFRGRG